MKSLCNKFCGWLMELPLWKAIVIEVVLLLVACFVWIFIVIPAIIDYLKYLSQ